MGLLRSRLSPKNYNILKAIVDIVFIIGMIYLLVMIPSEKQIAYDYGKQYACIEIRQEQFGYQIGDYNGEMPEVVLQNRT